MFQLGAKQVTGPRGEHYILYIILKLADAFKSTNGYDKATGSGEVHNSLGSLSLSRQLDCLPALRWPD